MQPVPISRRLISIRSRTVKCFRQSSRRCGSVPSRHFMMFSLSAAPSGSVGSGWSGLTESNMLSQQSRFSPIWVKMSKMA